MKKKVFIAYFFLTATALFVSSCSQKKHIAYYQNIEQVKNIESSAYESTIQPDDLLLILVSAPDSEAAAPFNLQSSIVPAVLGQNTVGQQQQQLYLVDKEGMIDFPVIGQLKLGGKTRVEVMTLFKEKLKLYLKNAIVNMRIMNYKISILGEVARPGVYPINSERITLPEALSLAGDLTIYGMRNNVMVVREIDGKKSHTRVDLTDANFFNSPYYYLSQNDLVYVEPNKAKASSSLFNQNSTVWISIASLVSSVVLSILILNNK